ncbi:MAG: DUF3572 domain-containing protein [Mangrovicoccus sp.]|nr:DUF3572 domain-containing protein [Mangrovicoccus sp.]
MTRPGRVPPASAEAAQVMALRIVEFLSREDGQIDAFLAVSGLSLDDFRERLTEPETLAAVMDFLLQEDARVIAFAADAGIAPEVIPGLRAFLPGGDLPHWT